MKVGSVGYATNQGLGILLRDFYENGIITDVLTVQHWRYPNFDWYNGPITCIKSFKEQMFVDFVKSMDVMFFFETPFILNGIDYCEALGVPSVLMPMYECTPRNLYPDLILNPSALDQMHWRAGKQVQVPIPYSVKWKQRKRARVFVHNAGHLGLNGRNGTRELLLAMQYVKSPIKLIIRSQEPLVNLPPGILSDSRIDIRVGTVRYGALYSEGDVFIFPEKFNGLSLPLQEAKASGMLIMCTNRFPMNTWNNPQYLIPDRGSKLSKVLTVRPTYESIIDPIDIAKTIDTWFDKDITEESERGKLYGKFNSWKYLKQTYTKEIENLFETKIGANK